MSKEDKKKELFSEEYFDSLETTLKDKKDMRRFESEETVNATDREIEELSLIHISEPTRPY